MTSSPAASSPSPRLAAFCRRASLLGAALFLALPPVAVQAQTLVQQVAEADPPSQVARLNLAEGEVSFSPADAAPAANAWTLAELNRPLTQGDRLWTGSGARAELHAGSTALRMNAQTSLDFLALDDSATRLSLPQGTLQLRVRALFDGQRLEVDTPNLAFVISQPGDYRLDVNPSGDSTRVVALSGGATLYGDNGQALALAGGQQATFTGTQLTPGAPGASVQDSFDAWAADRDRREDQSVAARYVPRDTIGYQQLDSYGDWNQDPTYGAVWLPRALPAAWAPYSAGHWNWITPWGWTWVDDAPWGFAPFHYGRWARIGPRWGWVPGRLAPRPVYAPALVAFVGGAGPGVNWNVTLGGRPRPGVGWFPLAPGEAYRPAYRASPRYITRVNNNITVNVNAAPSAQTYRFQRLPGAVTAASREDFMLGRPVRGERNRPDARELASAQALAPRAGLPPRPDRSFVRPTPGGAGLAPPPALVSRPVIGSRPERTADGRVDRPVGNPARPETLRPPTPTRGDDAVRQQRQAQQMQAAQQRQAEMAQQRQIRTQDPTRQRPGLPAERDQRDAPRPGPEQAQQQQRAQMDQQRQIREQDQARQVQRDQQDQHRLIREQQQAQQAQAQQQQRAQMDQQRQIREQDQARQAQARQVQRDQQDQHRLVREQQQAQQAQAQQQQRAQMDQQRQVREQDQARQAQARQASRAQQPQGQPGERQQGPRGQPPGDGEGRRNRPGGPPAQEP